MNMQAHGQLRTNWHNNILICEPIGGVNFEGAALFNKNIEQEISSKKLDTFARIMHFVDSDNLATQDAYATLESNILKNKSLGCVFLGLVGGNSVCRFYFESAAKAAELPYQYFDKLDTAINYIEDYLVNIK